MNISENIEKLILATDAGKIKWLKVNPTTYRLETTTSDGQRVNTILQKLKLKDKSELFLRLWDPDVKKVILEVTYNNSNEDIQNLLRDLYENISGSNLFLGDIFSDILRDL